jgi:hypothetical protein
VSTEETVKHVTPMSGHKVGFLKQKQCYLVFTDQRIVVAYHDPKKAQEEYEKKIDEHEKTGKKANIFKKIGAKWSTHTNFHQRYLEMDPENILQETTDNFSILPGSVAKLVLKRGSVSRDQDGFEHRNNDNLSIITTDNKKLSFTFVPRQFDSISHSLDYLIPNITHKRNKSFFTR